LSPATPHLLANNMLFLKTIQEVSLPLKDNLPDEGGNRQSCLPVKRFMFELPVK
jgi:hypothetical protein